MPGFSCYQITCDKLNIETFIPYSLAGIKRISGLGKTNTEMFI